MKYKGNLGKTIALKQIGLLSDADAYEKEAKRITDEMFGKFPDLFIVHQVTQGDWMALSLALAKAHVPGFKVVRPSGAPKKWESVARAEFRLDVDAIIEDKGLSVVESIKLAIRLYTWEAKTASMTIGALEKQYYSTDMRMVELIKKARSYELMVANN